MFKIIGVDPGTNYAGVSIMEVSDDLDVINIRPMLIDLTNPRYDVINNDLFYRLNRLYKISFDIFENELPIFLAIEAGFINRFRPAAYGPIAKSIYAIEKAFIDATGLNSIIEYPPSVVKQIIHGNWIANKDDMKSAVLSIYPNLPDNLTEHEYDATAIASTLLTQIKNRPEILWTDGFK
jgi:Holliday junction resolvasome RuvABC endonuclease subunit